MEEVVKNGNGKLFQSVGIDKRTNVKQHYNQYRLYATSNLNFSFA